jgi:hypothetical protein
MSQLAPNAPVVLTPSLNPYLQYKHHLQGFHRRCVPSHQKKLVKGTFFVMRSLYATRWILTCNFFLGVLGCVESGAETDDDFVALMKREIYNLNRASSEKRKLADKRKQLFLQAELNAKRLQEQRADGLGGEKVSLDVLGIGMGMGGTDLVFG